MSRPPALLCAAASGYDMPCYHPLEGYRSRERNASGKRSIVFSKSLGYADMPVVLPCGQCIGCRLERSRQWAIRCMHESSLHSDNCFITLTYGDDHLPSAGTLVKADFQKFMKRLRKKYGNKIRYFHCGEYGELLSRPHYHAIIFNHDFHDRELFSNTGSTPLYTSAALSALWPHGFSTIGDVTFESAAYVARYVVKKVNGDAAEKHYERILIETGEIYNLQPEYITMSLKPAIGKRWFEKYKTDVFPSDEIIMRGQQLKPPKYYDKLYDILAPERMAIIKGNRVKNGKKHADDATPDRLADRKKCKLAQITSLTRKL